jgi:hypothetical protein
MLIAHHVFVRCVLTFWNRKDLGILPNSWVIELDDVTMAARIPKIPNVRSKDSEIRNGSEIHYEGKGYRCKRTTFLVNLERASMKIK